MSKEPNKQKREEANTKLESVVSTRPLMKSDEELASTFESFLVRYPESLTSAEIKQHIKDLKTL